MVLLLEVGRDSHQQGMKDQSEFIDPGLDGDQSGPMFRLFDPLHHAHNIIAESDQTLSLRALGLDVVLGLHPLPHQHASRNLTHPTQRPPHLPLLTLRIYVQSIVVHRLHVVLEDLQLRVRQIPRHREQPLHRCLTTSLVFIGSHVLDLSVVGLQD